MEGADEVLSAGDVNGRLATDRSVDGRLERGRADGERNTAHPGGGRKPGQVADHPASQRQDEPISTDLVGGKKFVEPLERFETLGCFAG